MIHVGRRRSDHPGDAAQGSRLTHRTFSFVATGRSVSAAPHSHALVNAIPLEKLRTGATARNTCDHVAGCGNVSGRAALPIRERAAHSTSGVSARRSLPVRPLVLVNHGGTCAARASSSTIRGAARSTSYGNSSGRRSRRGTTRWRGGASQTNAVSVAGMSVSSRGATSVIKRRIAMARCSLLAQSLPVTSSSVPKPPVFSWNWRS